MEDDETQIEDTQIIDDGNQDDFGDLWDDAAKAQAEDNNDSGDGDADTDEDGNADAGDTTTDSDAGDGGDNTTGDDNSDDAGDDSDEDIELELSLSEDADDALVDSFTTILNSGQFNLDEEELVEMFDGTQESWDKILEANKTAGNTMAINGVIEAMPERGKDFIAYLIKMGGNADIDGWLDIERKAKDITAYDPATLTDDEAKAILIEDYKAKGLSDKKAKIIVEALEDEDEVTTEAKALLKEKLKTVQAAKDAKATEDAANLIQHQKAQKIQHQNVIKAINDTKFTKNKQKDIYDLLYTKDSGSQNSRIVDTLSNIIQNNPQQLVQLAQLFDGYTPEKGFDMKRLKAQVATKETKNVRRKIKRSTKPSTKGGQTKHTGSNKKSSIDDWTKGYEL